MKFGLFTCGYQRAALENAFADAVRFGYDYIELWGGWPHGFAPDLLSDDGAEVRGLIQRFGVPVKVYTPEHNAYPYNYMLGSPRQWEDSMEYLEAAIRAGAAVGAEYTLVSMGHSGGLPPQERTRRLERSLLRLADAAQRLGHALVVENLTPCESDVCTDLDSYAALLERLDHPALFGMCDAAAPFVQGEDPADYPRRLGSRMRHLHLVDSDGVSETHLVPGEGVMPLGRVLRDIRAAGYDGAATLELVTHYIDAPSRYARLALERAKELMV